MGTPKEDPEDEVPHENLVQRQDPDPDTGGSVLDVARGDITLSSLTTTIPEEKGLQSEQATKSDEKEGLAITAPEKVSTDTDQVNPTNGDGSSASNHVKGHLSTNDVKGSDNLHGDLERSGKEEETSRTPMLLQSKDISERGPSSLTSIHAMGHDLKVDPSAKQANEDSSGSEQKLNCDDDILTRESCEGGGIVAVTSSAGSDILPKIQTLNSAPNMRIKFVSGSNSLPQIQTPNDLLPSSQSNQEKFDLSIISEKSLDKLQPRRNPEISIRFTPPATPEKPLEDGFNWRKYGQKIVKGNGFVRSYYRCTHHNCVVKKQVERSNAGQLTDINYIGEHEHPRPQHIPQAIAVVQPSQMRMPELAVVSSPGGSTIVQPLSMRKQELSIVSSPEGSTNVQPLPMRKPELSVVSSPEGIRNVQPLSVRKPDVHIVSSPKAEKSSASHCVVPHFDESKNSAPPPAVDEDSVRNFTREEVDHTSGPDWKRRKICISSSDDPVLIKHSSEPRQVVQTMSEVDLVNDGYRWRKYGQKLVKGNLNPRSYYRCSSASGCPAKKHIERSSHDHKVVITTYEGQHNHEMPFTRGVAQNTSGGRGVAAVIGESRSSETGEKTNGLEMVLHIGAS